ncbi:hypothetical protein, partial [Streptococcus pneumoniae]|uniref:hypothetical protein n=1 Tax=Streptococcus pneumoniae TaxID=1313 RepID=UPI0019547953
IASVLAWKGRVPVALTRRALGPISEKVGLIKRTRAMLSLAPERLPTRSPIDRPAVHAAEGTRKGRVAILQGCAQPVLQP